ncbi:unnamed protein product [Vicia faba]|uniref:No apical meristem-associated C-terminal domain-containing protein n=1 Tax=Vicia faba TaxID=3906 RepID=A0AAV0YCN6_VICFA|nr:unnamed protein product [Vicia faba]
MDPNHFHYQQTMFNYMQNNQNPNSQNAQIPSVSTNPAIFFPSPNNPNMFPSPQMNSNSMEFFCHEPEIPIGFIWDEDILLIQSWLNVSKDPIVGVDQKAESFWVRVAANYNQYRGQSREKVGGQLKCRWHRINAMVQKFVGCYKQAVNGKKSGTSENDIMASAHAFFAQDQGTTFNLEYTWRLLKDESKWMGESIGSSSKITKTSASGASSENPDTHSSYEFDSSSPMERPMGQKAAKRKGKTNNIPTTTEDARNKRTTTMKRLVQCKEDEIEVKVMPIMMKDTCTMSDSQRDIHEKYCNKMKKNMECS